MRFTDEQKKQARQADLYEYLIRNHYDEFRHESHNLRFKKNKSINIHENYHGYTDFATGETGNSLDFLVRYMDYDMVQAVLALCGMHPAIPSPKKGYSTPANIPPVFPEAADSPFKQLYAYLTNRGISVATITMLIEQKIMYQDIQNNIVFCNKERDWGERRGTNTYADARCIYRNYCPNYIMGNHRWCIYMDTCESYKKDSYRGMIKNSREDGFWWFQVGEGKADKVYVCESSIDAISLYEIHQLNSIIENVVYISIGGTAKQPAIDRLKKHIKVILAVDNDSAGDLCRRRNPDLESIIPIHKDWNDDLLYLVS